MMQNSAQPTTEPVAKLDEVGHDRAMPSMSIAMWVAIGAGLFGLAMTLLLFKRSAGRMDLDRSASNGWHSTEPAAPTTRSTENQEIKNLSNSQFLILNYTISPTYAA